MDFLALNLPELGGTVESVKRAVSSQGMNAWGLAIVAFFVGLGALYALRGVVSRGKLWAFALYVIPLAILTFVLG